jgi:hypothetical protein
MRRVIAIFETSLGPDHPNVASSLNNLANLLQAANRPAEAAPLMLVIFPAFQRAIGHPHPHREVAIGTYRGVLSALGRGRGGIRLALRDACREAGLAIPDA